MTNALLEKMRAFLESEEGQKSISEWAKKYARDLDHRDRWIEKFRVRCESELDGVLEKLMDKYYSNEYLKRENKRGCEPREPLLWLAWSYAEKYCKPYKGKKHTNIFTSGAYHFGSYIIQRMDGQGSVLRIDKKK